jgi:Fe-Mn family superoxide dismutase
MFDDNKLTKIIRDSMGLETKKPTIAVKHEEVAPEVVSEALVITPKIFPQVTDNLSQKAKDAHFDAYKSYVETFNRVSAELDGADREEANSSHSDYRSLKFDEVFNCNGAYLHDLFFTNCFDPQSTLYVDTLSYMRLQRDFGTFDDWQHDFMACCMSSGNGWGVCGYNIYLRKYVNTLVELHNCNIMMGLIPIIVVDGWEHSYFRDYLGDKKSYIINMLKEINWRIVEERVKKCEKIEEALKS